MLRMTADHVASVHPCSHMLGEQRRAIVVVASVIAEDERVLLRRQGCDYVRKHIVRQPVRAIVVGLARPHPVARNSLIPLGAVGGLPGIIPDGEEGASLADRKVRFQIRTASGISVKLKWRAKGEAPIGGADVVDIGRVAAGTVLIIDVANYAIEPGRLTPALVPEVAAVIRK